jgi:hypothetical protein
MSNEFELADVIHTLRENLTEAQRRGFGQNIHFDVTNIDVELQTVVEKEGGGGLKFKVLSALEVDGNGKYKNAVTQKIKLSLQAVEIDQATGQRKNIQLSAEQKSEE